MDGKVLIYSPFSKAMLTRIAARFELIDAQGKPPREAFSADELGDVRAIITAGGEPLGRAVMESLPKLGAIVCYGTGYDGIDRAAAAQRNIVIGHSPAANSAAVADLSMTLLLAAVRRLLTADAYIRSGGWAAGQPSLRLAPPRGMTGRRIGVYGMGEIGSKIAARAAAFETEVGYYSRSQHDVPYPYHASLEALVEWCDVLMIAVRAGSDTRHVIDAAMLRRLGQGGIVINISRGSVIDQAALLTALQDHTIAGAGLDVFEVEPLAPGALSALSNVVLTPHLGGHTAESHIAMQDCVIENLSAFFAGRPLRYPVG
ncbi:lactate dehydrogenase-like 2-hydroxyacid dehydrogenase [Rhodopseudomonas rhenobacensis]|uniref:Lactate dehydrogenase-like 2-hydroxyacid dehydrogenase n=1 Tax=Rhodopseudomonas rhenobacensis TaxID=87461 RepID=A0A7W7Z7L0_9BRAD|nr:2-hydroxyacid dehydrogenase [Rhodopseudomonas rhenobacensis]MBB5048957.1 lactate dehydrogenase-like 2-hydroxyacid dehydrogenase [Rhodopseudomonas rhenobacensis]